MINLRKMKLGESFAMNEMKKCKMCNVEKQLTQFTKNNHLKDLLSNKCKACEEIRKCWSLKNLRPLCSLENLRKGKKIDFSLIIDKCLLPRNFHYDFPLTADLNH